MLPSEWRVRFSLFGKMKKRPFLHNSVQDRLRSHFGSFFWWPGRTDQVSLISHQNKGNVTKYIIIFSFDPRSTIPWSYHSLKKQRNKNTTTSRTSLFSLDYKTFRGFLNVGNNFSWFFYVKNNFSWFLMLRRKTFLGFWCWEENFFWVSFSESSFTFPWDFARCWCFSGRSLAAVFCLHNVNINIVKKHRKNCECCPVSLLIVRRQRL